MEATNFFPTGLGAIALDVPIVLWFNQKIDRKELIQSITVTVGGEGLFSRMLGGKKSYSALKLLTKKQLLKDRDRCDWLQALRTQVTNYPLGKKDWIAFVCQKAVPHNETVHVNIASGVRSAEGHLTTKSESSYSFTTLPSFNVTSGC